MATLSGPAAAPALSTEVVLRTVRTGLVYALLVGSIWFGESQSAESFAGMLLVVFGVLLSVIYSRRMRDLEKIESTIS